MKLTKKQLRQMIREAASEYVWGVKSPQRVANKYKISVLRQIIKEELEEVLKEELPGKAAVKSKRQKRKFIEHTRQLIVEMESIQKSKATMEEIETMFVRHGSTYDQDSFPVWHDAHQTLKERLRVLLKSGQHFENFKFSSNPYYQFHSPPRSDIGRLTNGGPELKELHEQVQKFLSELAAYVQKFARRPWRSYSATGSKSRYDNATTWSLLPDEDRDFILDYLSHSRETFTAPW